MWKLIKKYLKDERGFWSTALMALGGATQGAAKQKGAQIGQYNTAMSNAVANLGAPVAGRGTASKFAALTDGLGDGLLKGVSSGLAQEQNIERQSMYNKLAESQRAKLEAETAKLKGGSGKQNMGDVGMGQQIV